MKFSSNGFTSIACGMLLMAVSLNAHAADYITDEQQLSVKEKRAGEAYYRQDVRQSLRDAHST